MIFKIFDVDISEAASRFDLAPPDIDVSQLAVSDQAHDLIGRNSEPGGGIFYGEKRDHRRTPITVIHPFVGVNGKIRATAATMWRTAFDGRLLAGLAGAT